MKICWARLEGMHLSRNGNLRKGAVLYEERDSCLVCGEPYLEEIRRSRGMSKGFCSHFCSNKGVNHPSYGKKHNMKTKIKMSIARSGSKNPNYKGGVEELNIPLYDTFADRLSWAEAVNRNENNKDYLQVECTKCKTWFIPKRTDVRNRIYALNGFIAGEYRFYCSDSCKNSCDVYGQKLYPKNFKSDVEDKYNLRIWRKEVLKRANYRCEYCENNATDAHHIKPVKLEPFFILDPDNGIACCEKCHYIYGHKEECSTGNLASVICK